MNSIQESERAVAYKYEAVFCIFLAIMAYLGRENANLVYPTVLHFFLLLLSLNFSAILALRLWPSQEWFSALIILANCGVITGILSYSEGLNPTFGCSIYCPSTRSLYFCQAGGGLDYDRGRQLQHDFYFVSFNALSAATIFELCLKNGVFVFSAALTWRLAGAERRSLGQLRRQREELDRLDEKTRVQAAHDEQTEQLAAVGLISAGIVHDLKSPLMVIRGFTDICLQEKSLDSSIRRDLGSIRRATLRCQDLVAGILSAAKKEDTPRVECEIHELIESAVEFCGNMFADAGIDLEKKFNRHHLRVLGHPEQLERILLNLLGNAVKAMPSGGALTIRTKTDCMKDGRSRIMVLVEDTGTGISDEAMTNLFKPFSTTRPLAGGTGLGLYLSRDIAVKHGGSLQAENAPTGGARFTLTLPMETAPAREAVALRI